MQRESSSSRFPLGSKLPQFSLPAVSEKQIDQSFFHGCSAALVVFGCNHCPYVKGSDEHLVEVVNRYSPSGLKAVAISANDAEKYPEDSFEKMKKKAAELDLPYPYLYDESQEVAKAFDAQCTPECYLFNADLELVFHGAINDSPRDPAKVTTSYLDEAVKAVIGGTEVETPFAHPIGCSIKWATK